ncbi:hypothetical protein Pcinc_039297 [Petrolisthes cinctipes]|uniref:Uncharacterized protein n=1 Tax=Petrolisthes cinctipes TaxID=88211 RepID=A0AAE1BQ48_PETCI|nr:hypothetical protein Pcinc_039297 [Petrolisthes cinctipes]
MSREEKPDYLSLYVERVGTNWPPNRHVLGVTREHIATRSGKNIIVKRFPRERLRNGGCLVKMHTVGRLTSQAAPSQQDQAGDVTGIQHRAWKFAGAWSRAPVSQDA